MIALHATGILGSIGYIGRRPEYVYVPVLCFLRASVPAQGQSSAHKESKASMERMDADMKKGMDPDQAEAWAKMIAAHH